MSSNVSKEFVLSITPDCGTEFLQLADIRDDLSATIYWTDPYSPEQQGTNENTNGLIREYFPKGKRRPKKILSYRTPEEILFDKVLRLV